MKNKKKFSVLAILMIVILTLTCCLAACNPETPATPSDEEEVKTTEGLLISNSDFKVIDSTVSTYPRSATSWSGSKMYSSGSFKDDVTAGVISLEQDLYNANKSKWDDDGSIYNLLKADGRFGNDDLIKHALMVYMPKESTNSDGDKVHGPTAYGYTTSSFTLAKGSYYKLSVDVLTHDIDGANAAECGARIYVSSNTYAEFAAINTNDTWKTYTTYIETSPASTTSLTLMLGLGKYTSYYTTGLTTGYAFFSNVKLEKIADDASTPEIEGEVEFKNANDKLVAQSSGHEYITTTTLKVPNGTFDFGSTTISSSGTPSSWTLVTGNSGKDDPAPTALGFNSVIDLSKFDTEYTKYSSIYQERITGSETNSPYTPANDLGDIVDNVKNYSGRIGNNAFMLSQQLMTAQGIKTSRSITIEKKKTYALSVEIYTAAVHGAGVSLILTGADGKDIKIEGISSNKSSNVLIGSHIIDIDNQSYKSGEDVGASTNGWTTYTFYIKGNQYKDYSYNMAIWLGTEGTSSNNAVKYHSYTASNSSATTYDANGTFSNGWVFIDDLKLTEIAVTDIPAVDGTVTGEGNTLDVASGTNLVNLVVDLETENLFGDGDNNVIAYGKGTGNPSIAGAGVTAVGSGAPATWTSPVKTTEKDSPVIDQIISEGLVGIGNASDFRRDVGNAITYPELPYEIENQTAYMVSASQSSTYSSEYCFSIPANKFYRISVWIKTEDISSTSGAYIDLIDKKDDKGNSLAAFTKISTKDYDEYLKDWCELTIVVRGGDEDSPVALRFALGTGNKWAASTLTSGTLFVSNMSMTEITYANFKDTSTGTYVKSVNLLESHSYTVSNGNFDSYDLDDENLQAGKPLSEQTVAAKPENWTISDSKAEINKGDLFAGVVALVKDNAGLDYSGTQQIEDATGISQSTFANFFEPDPALGKDYLERCGLGPNMLAIGSKNTSSTYAIGYASNSLSLSSNNYYKISVYVKTVGTTTASIFLSGESSATGTNEFVIENATTWQKYTYYIEVGSTSVSVKLNLFLGRDKRFKDTDNESSGAVFFDNVVYTTIDEAKYNEAKDNLGATDSALSFMTDSFDALSGSIESRGELTKPDNWTGSADTNQTSSNTKAGIVYADSDYYETETVDGTAYAKILGTDYTADKITITDEQIAEAKGKSEYAGMTDEQIHDALVQEELIKQKKDNWIPTSALDNANSGDRMLVINNTVNSAYKYTSASNTLKSNSYYKVTVYARTYGVHGVDGDGTIGANIELYLGSAYDEDNPLIYKAITDDTWKAYVFYVRTLENDVTSVTVKLSLGAYSVENIEGEDVVSGLTRGYAMFDDVSIEKITEAEYANPAEETYLKQEVKDEVEGKPEDPGKTETPSKKFNLDMLWWMIPTIIIGLVIIAVVVVLVIRKVRKPIANKVAKAAVSNQSSGTNENLDKKHSRYDEGKE